MRDAGLSHPVLHVSGLRVHQLASVQPSLSIFKVGRPD